MVTLEDIEKAIWKYERDIISTINPMKVWQFRQVIKPEIEKIPNVKVIYPKYLFNYSSDILAEQKNTEFIILTNTEILLGVYKSEKFNIEPIEVNKIEIDTKDDRNIVSKVFDLDFSENISEIKKFIKTINISKLKELLKVDTNTQINNLFYADSSSNNLIAIYSNGEYIFNISLGELEKKYNGEYLVFEFIKGLNSTKRVLRLYEYESNKYNLVSNIDFENKIDIVEKFIGKKEEVYLKAIEFLIKF